MQPGGAADGMVNGTRLSSRQSAGGRGSSRQRQQQQQQQQQQARRGTGKAAGQQQQQQPPPVAARLRDLPSLPPFAAVKLADYAGPTDESNWVIPGMLMAGAYPAANEDGLHYQILGSLLSLGLSTFVCLQAEYEHNPAIPPSMWESGYKIRPYIFDAHRMLKQAESNPQKRYGQMCPPSSLDFIHVPIVDCSTTNDDTIFNLALEIVRRLRSGENIYCHCWGGHGRAGTVISVVLGLLYNLSPAAAMKRCQHFHDQRRARLDVPSPQTESQRSQVARILTKYHHERRQREAADKAAAAQFQKQQAAMMAAASSAAAPDNMRIDTRTLQQQQQQQRQQQQQQQQQQIGSRGSKRPRQQQVKTTQQRQKQMQQRNGMGVVPQAKLHAKSNGKASEVRGASEAGAAGNMSPRGQRTLAPPNTLAAKQYVENAQSAAQRKVRGGVLPRAHTHAPPPLLWSASHRVLVSLDFGAHALPLFYDTISCAFGAARKVQWKGRRLARALHDQRWRGRRRCCDRQPRRRWQRIPPAPAAAAAAAAEAEADGEQGRRRGVEP